MAGESFVIIGTAGHIDHGKTTLVKALTGKDTDQFKEEKERGISIDIGFAPFALPDGRLIGVVDVPGHEKFIKNMLAGAAGIDLILLVIDAGEGIMPQTTEHLRILEMLHVQKGIVVLTKIDTVDDEWLDLVREEVREGLAGTLLADSPMVDVSAVTGQGLDPLRSKIAEMTSDLQPRDIRAAFRLPTDRIFSIPGFGTVVTGTIAAGTVRIGDTLEILPPQKKCRVRSLQVHGKPAEVAQAGQRTALNLTGIDKHEIERGFIVAKPDVFRPTQLMDARLRLLKESPRTLTNRTRIRFYTGTSETLGKVILLDRDELLPGEEALVQIDLEESVVCDLQDHYIIRSYSPMYTLGGGHIIDPYPPRLHRRKKDEILEDLQVRESGGPTAKVEHLLQSSTSLSVTEIANDLKLAVDAVKAALHELGESQEVTLITQDQYTSTAVLEETLDEMEEQIREHYRKERFHLFVSKAQVTSRLSRKWRPKVIDAILQKGVDSGRFFIQGDRIQIAGYKVPLSTKESEWSRTIRQLYEEQSYQPPSVQELQSRFAGQDKVVEGLLSILKEEGFLTEVAQGVFFSTQTIQDAKEWAGTHGQGDGFTVAEFRDAVGTSRKYALALLEYLDSIKVTKRVEDRRIFTKP